MKPVFDTSILIDYLTGKQPARDELARYPQRRISIVTWTEIMGAASGKTEHTAIRKFLNCFDTVPLDEQVAETAVRLRRQHRLRMPDALVWASARNTESLLITRNTAGYPEGEPDIRFPYTL